MTAGASVLRAKLINLINPKCHFSRIHPSCEIQGVTKLSTDCGVILGAGAQVIILGNSSAVHFGKDSSIGPNVRLLVVDSTLTIDSRVSFNSGTSVDAIKSPTVIKSGVRVGSNCHIGAASHDWRLLGTDNYEDLDSCPLKLHPTHIGEGCWICSNTVLAAGTNLPPDTIIPPFTKTTFSSTFMAKYSFAERPVFFPSER